MAVETTTISASLHVLGLVADEGLDALLVEALDVVVVGGVRALHRVAEIVHDLGDAGHADAADADEVDGAELRRQFHGLMFRYRVGWTRASRTAWARRSAASVMPALWRRRRPVVKRPGSPKKAAISAARRSGVNAGLRKNDGGADVSEGRGVGGLVLVEGARQGHQDRRAGRSPRVRPPSRRPSGRSRDGLRRCRCGRSLKNGSTSTPRPAGRGNGSRTRSRSSLARLLARSRAGRACSGGSSCDRRAARCRSSPARPGCRRRRGAGAARPARAAG